MIGLDETVGGKTSHSSMVLTSDLPFLRLHPVWHVQVTPATLTVAVPVGLGTPTVDGIPVPGRSGASTSIAVLPGHHLVGATAGALLAASAQGVDTEANGAQTVSLKTTLTPAGEQAAAAAVKAAFARCLALVGVPAGCPQRLFTQESDFTGATWTAVGDPSDGLTFGVDAAGAVAASGHFQIVANGQVPEGSAFVLPLAASGSTFSGGDFRQREQVSFGRPRQQMQRFSMRSRPHLSHARPPLGQSLVIAHRASRQRRPTWFGPSRGIRSPTPRLPSTPRRGSCRSRDP